jgi:hypothetical protein
MTTTIQNIDEYIQSLSVRELKAIHKDIEPIELNWTEEELAKSERIYKLIDATNLDYSVIEMILDNPKKAALGDIQIYCNQLNINLFSFIQQALD